MKYLKFLLVGIFFGVVMTKSEAVSWFRIQEMFRFESFHMYGIIGTAVVVGVIITFMMKKAGMKSMQGEPLKLNPKEMSIARYIIGGTIFGLGWAITGACPGPMFTILGHGVFSILIVIAGAIVGTYTYGAIKSKLPH